MLSFVVNVGSDDLEAGGLGDLFNDVRRRMAVRRLRKRRRGCSSAWAPACTLAWAHSCIPVLARSGTSGGAAWCRPVVALWCMPVQRKKHHLDFH